LKSRGGGDVHDAATAACDHRRQKEAREFRECSNVEVDLAEDFFPSHLREFPEGAETGIVDKSVNDNALALQLIEKKCWCRWTREIERDGLDGGAASLQSLATCASLSVLRATSMRL
jgi:hypothetical protein